MPEREPKPGIPAEGGSPLASLGGVIRRLLGPDAAADPRAALHEIGAAAGAACAFVLRNAPDEPTPASATPILEWLAGREAGAQAVLAGQAWDWTEPGLAEWGARLARADAVLAERPEARGALAEALDAANAESLLLLPITVEERWWGALGVLGPSAEHRWPLDELEALRLAADALGAYLARAGEEARLRAERDLARDLLSFRSVEEALPRCLQAAVEVSGADCGGLFLVDRDAGELRLACHIGVSDAFAEAAGRFSMDSPLARLLSGGAPVTREEAAPAMDGVQAIFEAEGLGAAVAAPVLAHGEVIATINVACRGRGVFAPPREDALLAVAGLIGNAIARLRAEEELGAHERDLRSLFDSAGDLLFVLDADWRYVHVNQSTLDTLGYRRDELIGQLASVLRPQDSVPVGRETLRTAWETGEAVCDLPLVRRDGTEIPSETRFTRGLWSGRRALLGIARDISGRLRFAERESALARLATRLAGASEPEMMIRVVREETDALFAWDAHYFAVREPDRPGLTVLTFIDTVNGERVDFPGTDWSDEPPRPLLGLVETGRPVLINRSPGELDPPLSRFGDENRPSASLVVAPVRSGDQVIGVVSVQSYTYGRYGEKDRDLLLRVADTIAPALERASAQAALRESEERYRTIFETSPEAILLVDREGVVLDANAVTCTLLGLPLDALVGRSLLEFPLADRVEPAVLARNLEERLSGVALAPYRVDYTDFQGRRRSARVIGAPFRDSSGVVCGAVYMLSDTTDQDQLEERVREAQRLQSLTLLAGGVAHDFNNVLTGVLGSVDLALDSLQPDSPARPHVDRIGDSARRLAKIAEQMLFYSGHSVLAPEPMRASAIVEGVSDLLRAMLPEGLHLALDLPPNAPLIRADARQMSQTLSNTLLNAIEAMDGRPGTVTIRTGVVSLSAADLAEVRSMGRRLAPGDYAFIDTVDAGAGMDEATRARMFDPFFTTKFPGRGLGLAAALGIVCAHEGGIQVISSPGAGTTVRILVPALSDAAEAERRAGLARPNAARPDAVVVLLVDDEPSVRETAKLGLESAGYRVLTAADGIEAVDVLAGRPDGVSLALLDLTMPRLSGQETLERLRQLAPGLPVVLMSGFDESTVSGTFDDARPTAFLQKPFRLAELLRTVDRTLAGGEGEAG